MSFISDSFNENIKSKSAGTEIVIILLISIGIFLRFAVMSLGHNFDFESYCIVGEIAGHFRNVYAETSRYNYGPVFFIIQGVLYRTADIIKGDTALIYRVLMVSVLTLTDLFITFWIACRHSRLLAVIFFLNPVSIIITGYHNQFDNMAVLLGLITILFYNEEEKFSSRDLGFVFSLTLCFMTKHILFVLPAFILLRKNLNIYKKLVYAFIPPMLFLAGFLPFIIGNGEAFEGVKQNVFFYRSFNNAPLLDPIYQLLNIQESFKFYIFIIFMLITAFITRGIDYERQFLIYLIALVAFSSAIANQYLAIPMAALCILNTGILKYIYMIAVTWLFVLNHGGLELAEPINERVPSLVAGFNDWHIEHGYTVAALILFVIYIYLIKSIYKNKAPNSEE